LRPLSRLPPGRAARVVRVAASPRQVRLASLGLLPGARIGATTLALEREIGEEILVQLEDVE
jgi:Fe2+ transport system protein FeoA